MAEVNSGSKICDYYQYLFLQHVGIRRYSQFLSQVYDLLDDDGIFVFQVAGIRPAWQFEDLIWGLFMNKYIFPGADASCSLGWVINKVGAVFLACPLG